MPDADPGGTSAFAPPTVHFHGRLWPSDELTRIAEGWARRVRRDGGTATGLHAMVLGNHPEAVALLFALSSFPVPLLILPEEPRGWRSSPPIPAGTPLFLPPHFATLAPAGEAVGLRPRLLPAPEAFPPHGDGGAPFLSSPGMVAFTSGSTAAPKPVYRTTAGLLTEAAAIVRARRPPGTGGVVGTLPLALYGFYAVVHMLMIPLLLGTHLGLLRRFGHRSLLSLLDAADYGYWPATPMMVDLVSRCRIRERPPKLAFCVAAGGRLSPTAFQTFWERFGTPPRQQYGMSENGVITTDNAPEAEVRRESAGRPVPGVELGVAEDPRHPEPPGTPGKLWLRSRWYAEGYGFPPRVGPPPSCDGWRTTGDLGILDETGRLTLLGREDDCFKTAGGYLVSPVAIADAVTSHPAVRDAAVVPLSAPVGHAIGVLAEGPTDLDPVELRAHAARRLPLWAQPHVVIVTQELPRVRGDKVDRRACIEILRAHVAGEATP